MKIHVALQNDSVKTGDEASGVISSPECRVNRKNSAA
jgi:hypothetical protein